VIKLNLKFAEGLSEIELSGVKAMLVSLDQESTITVPKLATINVRIVDQSRVKEYNARYSGKNEATDVLSFNYGEEHPRFDSELGDIVISHQHVCTQASRYGIGASEELSLLTLHGILHILGYDHATKTQQELVENLQEKIMNHAGLQTRKFKWKD
jgi:probable rRNA maturation factor